MKNIVKYVMHVLLFYKINKTKQYRVNLLKIQFLFVWVVGLGWALNYYLLDDLYGSYEHGLKCYFDPLTHSSYKTIMPKPKVSKERGKKQCCYLSKVIEIKTNRTSNSLFNLLFSFIEFCVLIITFTK